MSTMVVWRDALRVLFILAKCCEPYDSTTLPGYTGIFRGEAKLHACDFWMRYPDYLADELMNRFEEKEKIADLVVVRNILLEKEPDLRRVPMIRYHFGAYEPIDNTMAILSSRELVKIERVLEGRRVKETYFLVSERAFALVDSISAKWPILDWYAQRAALVAELVKGRGGKSLKEQQYKQIEYKETELEKVISCITQRVQERYSRLSGELLEG